MNRVLEKRLLSSVNSSNKVYHLSIESNFPYEPGDIIGIYPKNSKRLEERMSKFISNINFDNYDLRLPSRLLLKEIAKFNKEIEKISLPTNFLDQRRFIMNNSVPDIVERYGLPKERIEDLLSPMRPRSYSIASSRKLYRNEVHLMVSIERFKTDKGVEKGTTSSYVDEDLKVGDSMKIEYKENKKFRLPVKDENMLMIGPGTGLAPFIGFLQEREETKSKKWLFFGEKRYEDNFYYKEYLQRLSSLRKIELDLAFSRDKGRKIYVQDLLWQKRDKIKEFIEDAYIYICGNRVMAHDVEKTFLKLLDEREEEARKKLTFLKKEQRYVTDVY